MIFLTWLSILMTTHDFGLLPRYADQVVLIDGSVRDQGTPEAVLSGEAFSGIFYRKGASQ